MVRGVSLYFLERDRGDLMSKVACYFKNGLGNLAMMSPALQAFKQLHSPCELHIFIDKKIDGGTNWTAGRKKSSVEILESFPFVDKIIEYSGQEIPKTYTDYFASPHGEKGITYDLFMERGAFNKIHPHDWFKRKMHEIEHYMEICFIKGYRGDLPDMFFPVAEKPKLKNRKRIVLSNSHYPVKVWEKRRYPFYPELAKALIDYYGVEVIAVGGKLDLWWTEDLPKEVKNYVGKTTITETAKIIDQSNLVITIDTSVLHIASALKVPVIQLFGASSFAKNGAWKTINKVVRGKVDCIGCRQRGNELWNCKEEYPAKCMESISVGDIINTVRDLENKYKVITRKVRS